VQREVLPGLNLARNLVLVIAPGSGLGHAEDQRDPPHGQPFVEESTDQCAPVVDRQVQRCVPELRTGPLAK